MNQPGDQPVRRAAPRRLPWIVLVAGLVWCATAITCSALLVPPDEGGGFYLIDHGRTVHYDSRLAAVFPFIAISGLLCVLAAGVLSILALRARTGPSRAPVPSLIGLALAAGFPLLLGGLIPLSPGLSVSR